VRISKTNADASIYNNVKKPAELRAGIDGKSFG
jgi:hypothetical protein